MRDRLHITADREEIAIQKHLARIREWEGIDDGSTRREGYQLKKDKHAGAGTYVF